MSHEGLPLELRRNIYLFVLFLYEVFEALPERGILVSDIESNANRILSKVAQFAVSDNPKGQLRDILGEFKSLKALLGIVRDTSVLERGKAVSLIGQCAKLEETFDNLNLKAKAEAEIEAVDERQAVTEVAREILGPAVEAIREMAQKTVEVQDEFRPLELAESRHLGTTSDMSFIERPDDKDPTDQEPERLDQVNNVGDTNEGGDQLSLRQKAIMEVLKRRDKVTVGDLGMLFSGRVSKKTLQRDLQDLVSRKVIQRKGDRRWAVYYI